jgi:uncharacterized protein YoxC
VSLLDDLHGLDISGIVNARGSISSAISAPALQNVLSSGPASSVLGSLGSSLDAMTGSLDKPDALLAPIVQAVSGLGVHFDASGLPLDKLGQAVRDGVQFVSGLTAAVSGDPSDFGKIFGTALGDAMQVAGKQSTFFEGFFGGGAGSFSELERMAAQGTTDTSALVDLALGILLPLPAAQLKAAKGGLDIVVSGSAGITLPTGRAAGLVAALDAVTAAAEGGDATRLTRVLADLAAVRAHTLGVLRDDLRFVASRLGALRVDAVLQPVATFAATVRHGEQGAIEFLGDLRGVLRDARSHVDNLDFAAIRDFLTSLAKVIEDQATEQIDRPIDAAVEKAKTFVRRTFRQIPILPLREELTSFLLGAASAIENAHLDAPADAVRDALAKIASALDAGALTAGIKDALQAISKTITDTLKPITDALETIGNEVDQLAGAAEGILGKVTDALAAFQSAVDQVSTAIDGLGLDQAVQQMTSQLDNLRQQVQQLLSNVPLPEPLRPQVEQLTSLLEGIDLDAMLQPARDAVAQLKIPDDVDGAVRGGLDQSKQVIENLVPQQLIASIQAEVDKVLETLKGFHPESLIPDVSSYLETAAQHIEQLDPRPLAEQIRGPFQAVLDVIDRANPFTLLKPVIDLYDSLMSAIPVPGAQSVATALRAPLDLAGGQAASTLGAPPAAAAGGSTTAGATGGADAGAGAGGAGGAGAGAAAPSAQLPPALSEIHGGDPIRLLGLVPAKLRDTLKALEAGPLGTVLNAIDAHCAGLALQIRGVQAALYDVTTRLDANFEALLTELGPASLRAHLAIQAHFAADASLHISLDAVTAAGPGALRRDLEDLRSSLRALAQQVAGAAGGTTGASLERLAVALESSALASLARDTEQFLAALDPEPIAADLDGFVDHMLHMVPQLASELVDDLEAFTTRLRTLITHFSPGSQAQKFLAVLDVLREEFDAFNPRRLAAELSELHRAIRAAVAAYDPRALADEIAAVTRALAQQIRALDPKTLLGDIDFLKPIVAGIEQANPATRLAQVGKSLTALGERLGEIHLDQLIAAVNALGPKLEGAFEAMLKAVQQEIVALLESLRYGTGSASVSVSGSVDGR